MTPSFRSRASNTNTSRASPGSPTQSAQLSPHENPGRMKIFNLPDLGEGLAEAEIVRWHVKTGDHVAADDPMLAVETAKAVVEVPSPFSGVIKAIHGDPGDTVATGALLVEFEPDASAVGAQRHQPADAGTVVGTMPTADENFVYGANNSTVRANAAHSDRVRAIPAARALAKRLSLDITQIQGTGRGQLVTVDDVLRMTPATGAPAASHASQMPGAQRPGSAIQESERLKGPRRAMAQSMASSR